MALFLIGFCVGIISGMVIFGLDERKQNENS